MLTEQRAIPPPRVIGLLRSPGAGTPGRKAALSDVLREFCGFRELNLVEVITNDGAGLDDVVARITREDDLYAVVLPTESHLGVRTDAARRRRQIVGAGIRLVIVRGRTAG
ncbi:hypothetical protein ACFVHB_12310 [Kitasatospora sp. NPDC127111]|uniref:hypothetical protein n=1 Tax=Kitasatospora sp. NPDC127111 TaxID=3345363 RepID=UPI00362865F1